MKNKNLIETKTTLAKLLAGENVTVLYENIPTAGFDLEKRILHCPNWDASPELHDLLLGHEIGHALYTPAEGWHNAIFKCKENHNHTNACFDSNFKGFLNICEDVRIERKIKTKYPGLKRSFAIGYNQLWDKDFFGVKKINVNTLNLIDRINLYFKVGGYIRVKFTKKERDIITRLEKAETFSEIKKIAREVYFLCGKEKSQIQNLSQLEDAIISPSSFEEVDENSEYFDSIQTEELTDSNTPSKDLNNSDKSESNKSESEKSNDSEQNVDDQKSNNSEKSRESKNSDKSEKDSESGTTSSIKGGKNTDDEQKIMSITDHVFREREHHLNSTDQVINVTLPQANLNKIIYPVEYVVNFFEERMKRDEYNNITDKIITYFIKKHKEYISLLVKEFEMRKNAKKYSLTKRFKTGELDTNRIAEYRFSNDIFLRENKVPRGKNHGMIMYLDMSGSMGGKYMFHSIEQIMILVNFCRMVRIPFEIYGFADVNEYDFNKVMRRGSKPRWSSNPTDLVINSNRFHLRHLISSQTSLGMQKRSLRMLAAYAIQHADGITGKDKTLEELMFDFGKMYTKTSNPKYSHLYIPRNGLSLGGTPLIETILASRQMINDFKEKKNLDIVNVIYLTDGEGCSPGLPNNDYNWDKPLKILISDPVTKKQVILEDFLNNTKELQSKIMGLIKSSTGCRHIGYYITDENYIKSFIDNIVVGKENKLIAKNTLKENGFFSDEMSGFDTYYYITTKFMGYKEPELVESTKNSELSEKSFYNRFINDQNHKKSARVILSKFAQEISNSI